MTCSSLFDDKPVASCQQTCCELIVKTSDHKVILTRCNKSAKDMSQQVYTLILTEFLQPDEIDEFDATC